LFETHPSLRKMFEDVREDESVEAFLLEREDLVGSERASASEVTGSDGDSFRVHVDSVDLSPLANEDGLRSRTSTAKGTDDLSVFGDHAEHVETRLVSERVRIGGRARDGRR
jgi:hypothetical protein